MLRKIRWMTDGKSKVHENSGGVDEMKIAIIMIATGIHTDGGNSIHNVVDIWDI